jgi:hypothetical protein
MLSEKLIKIQSELKSPKNQRNSFGRYNYRSCEDILEAVKPILLKHKVALSISDDIQEVGGRVYVCAYATLTDSETAIDEYTAKQETCTVKAYARESENKKGMDESQITGAASSYARKYALNGLFLIDDTKDADATNDHNKVNIKQTEAQNTKDLEERIKKHIENSKTLEELSKCKAHLTEQTKKIYIAKTAELGKL